LNILLKVRLGKGTEEEKWKNIVNLGRWEDEKKEEEK